MALVRCPKHKIPYNDENPRGCPACAREKSGDRKSLMQELARAQQPATKLHTSGQAAPEAQPRMTRETGYPLRAPVPHPLAVTTPPKQPTSGEGAAGKIWRKVGYRRFYVAGGALIVMLVAVLWLTSGPRFTPGVNPAPVADADVRPLPLDPNAPIALVFAALGTKSPQQNPDDQRLFRYTYGSHMVVDALDGSVYSVTLRVPNRSWHGLRVGMNEQRTMGELALLGAPQEVEVADGDRGQIVGGYVVYSSLEARPRRRLEARVRPPNGCFDVIVDLQPRAIGSVDVGEQRYVAVSREGAPPDWVVTRIRIVSRSMAGPYAAGPAC
jgi:hypothetical protein